MLSGLRSLPLGPVLQQCSRKCWFSGSSADQPFEDVLRWPEAMKASVILDPSFSRTRVELKLPLIPPTAKDKVI